MYIPDSTLGVFSGRGINEDRCPHVLGYIDQAANTTAQVGFHNISTSPATALYLFSFSSLCVETYIPRWIAAGWMLPKGFQSLLRMHPTKMLASLAAAAHPYPNAQRHQ